MESQRLHTSKVVDLHVLPISASIFTQSKNMHARCVITHVA